MGLALGDYFRRLRDESERFARTGRWTIPDKRRARHGGAQPSIQVLLDDPGRIDELFGSTVHRLSMLGEHRHWTRTFVSGGRHASDILWLWV